jgi:hypothetical protein
MRGVSLNRDRPLVLAIEGNSRKAGGRQDFSGGQTANFEGEPVGFPCSLVRLGQPTYNLSK